MDYDKSDISEVYQGARDLPAETICAWMNAIRSHAKGATIRTIADVGSGTGRFSSALADAFDAVVVGVEPSEKMRAIAEKNCATPNVRFIRGSAEDLPLNDASADMVFMSMVVHHFRDADKALREAYRVLRDGGLLVMRNTTRENVLTMPLFDYFQEAKDTDLCRLPGRDDLMARVSRCGIWQVELESVRQLFARNHMIYLDKIAQRALSSMKLISDEAFDRGLSRFRVYCQAHADEPVYEEIDLLVAGKGQAR